MYPFYLGIDLHLKRTYVVLMDERGEVIDQRRLPNDSVRDYLTHNVPRETYAVLEATRNWPFMYDLLSDHVERVELAHPKKLKAIASAAVKTDQIDAKVLANLARMNYLPIAYAAPAKIRDLRLWTRHREWLIGQRTQSKNRIQAALATYNLVSPVTDLFGVKGRQFLKEVMEKRLRSAASRVVADNLRVIDQLDERIQALKEDLPLGPEQEKIVKLLQTVPGIGRVHAITILAEIGDIQRFNNPKALCNWSGLTPRVRKSDRIEHHGKISKQGSPYLRSAMVRAAMVAARVSPRWLKVYERLSPRCGKRAARVAVGRRLLTVVYYMLKNGQPYQENYEQIKR